MGFFTLFYCLLDLRCGESDVIFLYFMCCSVNVSVCLYLCMLCVALLMYLFVLCVTCL